MNATPDQYPTVIQLTVTGDFVLSEADRGWLSALEIDPTDATAILKELGWHEPTANTSEILEAHYAPTAEGPKERFDVV